MDDMGSSSDTGAGRIERFRNIMLDIAAKDVSNQKYMNAIDAYTMLFPVVSDAAASLLQEGISPDRSGP